MVCLLLNKPRLVLKLSKILWNRLGFNLNLARCALRVATRRVDDRFIGLNARVPDRDPLGLATWIHGWEATMFGLPCNEANASKVVARGGLRPHNTNTETATTQQRHNDTPRHRDTETPTPTITGISSVII